MSAAKFVAELKLHVISKIIWGWSVCWWIKDLLGQKELTFQNAVELATSYDIVELKSQDMARADVESSNEKNSMVHHYQQMCI